MAAGEFSIKSLNKYLAIKKQVKAPNDEAKEAKKIPGYVGVYVNKEDPTKVNSSYVIALAETFWSAEKAAKVIKVEWNNGPNSNISSESIRDYAISKIKDPDAGAAFVKEGNFYTSFNEAL